MDNPRIDDIVRRLLESVPPGLRAIQKDLEGNFRAVLRASLSRLDLVSRDEFEAQMRVLERTRARLEELERRVAEMEGGASPGGAAAAGAGAAGAATGGDTAGGVAPGAGDGPTRGGPGGAH
jgi:BMFP domain-containing protein YqiC